MMYREVGVRQHNVAHRIATHDAMMVWLNQETLPWIICLQEPQVTQRGMTKLPRSYTAHWSVRCTTSKMPKRITNTAVIAPKSLKGYMVSQHSDINCVVVRFDSLNISVVSVYCSIHDTIEKSTKLITDEVATGRQVVVCMDTNAHHVQWGSTIKRRQQTTAFYRGKELMEIMDEAGLLICNNIPHRHTYVSDMPGKSTHIDVTFASDGIINKIVDWEVHEETLDSDHRYITFKVMNYAQRRENESNDTTWTGIPWKNPTKKREKVMEERLMELVRTRAKIHNINDIDDFVEIHTEEIRKALGIAFKKRKREDKRLVYWWNDEVAEAYEEMKKARKRKGRYGHESMRVYFKQCRNRFRYLIKKTKKESWEKFTNSITDPWSGFMKIINATDCGKSLSKTLCDENGNYADSLKETLKSLSNCFFPPPLPLLQVHQAIINKVNDRLQRPTSQHINITVSEFRLALSSMSKGTAPGFDTITNNVIQKLVTVGGFESQYIRLFNVCLKKQFFPSAWKSAKVITIPKAHTMADSVKSLRPISLTSSFGKLLERIVLARIMYYLQASKCISENQHAYRRGFSTQTALQQVFGYVHEALDNKQVCIAVFLDISGAFDRTWHFGILNKLLDYGVPSDLVAFVKNFLSGRTATIKECDEEHEVSLKQGCPQGGVLSPALWNILFNDMLCIKSPAGNDVSIVAYADDAVVLCRAKTVAAASKLATEHLKKIYEWSITNRVMFNTAKLATMTLFSQRHRLPPPSAVYFNNVLVKEVSRYKYLGLILDNRLKWKDHIEGLLARMMNVIRTLRRAVREKWGIQMEVLRTLYHAIFVPIMTYGIAVWGWRAQTQEMILKFNKVIRQYCLMATRCLRSTANLVLFRLMRTSDFKSILYNSVRRITLLQLQMYNNEVRRRREGGVMESDRKNMEVFQWKCTNNVRYEREVEYNDNEESYAVHPAQRRITMTTAKDKDIACWNAVNISGWCIYTDASASSYGRGWAFVVFHHGFFISKQYAALTKCSIFEAESYAVLQAVLYTECIQCLKRNEVIEIRTDAKSVVMALGKIVPTDPVIVMIKGALKKVEELGIRIRIVWVPGHSSVFGNELVDGIAKRAVDSKCVHEIAMYARELRRMIGEIERKQEEMKWEEYKAVVPKSFFPKLQNFHAFVKSAPSVPLIQLVTGHTRLNKFVYKIYGRVDSPFCRCDEEEESVEHFLFNCPIYDEVRMNIWPDFRPTYAFISDDWGKLNQYVVSTRRFSNTIFPSVNPLNNNFVDDVDVY